jgi:Uma2 family endonuclease
MATVLKIGPIDRGRSMTREEYLSVDYQEGYHYELIRGKLYLSPPPNLPEDWVEQWLYDRLKDYASQHWQVINYVTNKARIFVPGEQRTTAPEPDVAAFRDFPTHLPIRELRWQDVSPVLVGEVLSTDDSDKDLVRNVELYLLVPSIKEYWLLDPRTNPDEPTLLVYRRHGKRWRSPIELGHGETYTTKLLPGFALKIDPRS